MTSWLNVAAVAAGGAFGSVARYLLTVLIAAIPGGSTVLGTTVANLLGCAAMGALAVYAELEGALSERAAVALTIAFGSGQASESNDQSPLFVQW